MRSSVRLIMFRGPGHSALVLSLGIVLILNGALCVMDDSHESLQEHKDEDYHKISERLDEVTARLEHIDHHLDKRLSPKIRQKALSLEHRVSQLEEDHCDKDHYDCGGQDHECIGKLMVCDGHRDCRNGEDEKHCKLPANTGDKFVGYPVYDNCGRGRVDKLTSIVTAVQVRPAFPGFPKVRVILHGVDKSGVGRTEIAFHLVGYYRFSTNKLVLFAPPGLETSEGLAVICEFDGHNQDRCVARIVNKGSLTSCAKYVFFRERRQRHDDNHH